MKGPGGTMRHDQAELSLVLALDAAPTDDIALQRIDAWNARCDEIDKGETRNGNGTVTGKCKDDFGSLVYVKCPVCGRTFTDADVGHRHVWKDHR